MQITKDTTIAFLAVILLALGALIAAAKTQAAISPQVLSAYGIMRMPGGEYMETGAGARTEAKPAGGSGHIMPNGEYMETGAGAGAKKAGSGGHIMPNGEYMEMGAGAGAGAGARTEAKKAGSGGHTMPNGEYMEGSGGGHDAVPNDNTSYLKRMKAGNAQQHLH